MSHPCADAWTDARTHGRKDARGRTHKREERKRGRMSRRLCEGRESRLGHDPHTRGRTDASPGPNAPQRRTCKRCERTSARGAQVRECRVQSAGAQGTADGECEILCNIPPPLIEGGILTHCTLAAPTLHSAKISAIAHLIFAQLHSSLEVRLTLVKQSRKGLVKGLLTQHAKIWYTTHRQA